MSCHPSRISYELFTKCVTPNVTHVHHLIVSAWQVATPSIKFLNTISPRHGKPYFIWPALPRIPRTLSRVLPSLARQIACHGVNPSSCHCEACFSRYSIANSDCRVPKTTAACPPQELIDTIIEMTWRRRWAIYHNTDKHHAILSTSTPPPCPPRQSSLSPETVA